jgi:hypothetical protein
MSQLESSDPDVISRKGLIEAQINDVLVRKLWEEECQKMKPSLKLLVFMSNMVY